MSHFQLLVIKITSLTFTVVDNWKDPSYLLLSSPAMAAPQALLRALLGLPSFPLLFPDFLRKDRNRFLCCAFSEHYVIIVTVS